MIGKLQSQMRRMKLELTELHKLNKDRIKLAAIMDKAPIETPHPDDEAPGATFLTDMDPFADQASSRASSASAVSARGRSPHLAPRHAPQASKPPARAAAAKRAGAGAGAGGTGKVKAAPAPAKATTPRDRAPGGPRLGGGGGGGRGGSEKGRVRKPLPLPSLRRPRTWRVCSWRTRGPRRVRCSQTQTMKERPRSPPTAGRMRTRGGRRPQHTRNG